MRSEHWQQIEGLFHAALEREPSERAAFLSEACGDNISLRSAIESLLTHHEQADSFIESSAFSISAVLGEQPESLVGKTFGNYRVLEMLGEGGMGQVYLAQDNKLGRKVALKFLARYFTQEKDRLRRFEQEARAASALNHPNIITIYEIGEAEAHHFIATEFIDGQTLRERMKRTPMSLSEVLEVAVQTASALAAAHAAGIAHRDIKPENIMVRRDGIVKVLDFGLAKLAAPESAPVEAEGASQALYRTDPGIILGTTIYMSPEQARGLQVDARTDIFSLGVLLYEMVAGCLPFAGSTPSEVLASILSEKEPQPLAR